MTTLSLRSYLPLHIFVGIALLAPIALKLASTGWRFLRYYTGSKPYRLEGPPRLTLRLLAPLLIASTLSLFGSGVAMIVVGHGGGPLLTLHAVSFGVWGALVVVHILAYLGRVLTVGTADWRPRHAPVVAGARSRRGALCGALGEGVIIALATYPAQQAWMSHRRAQRRAPELAMPEASVRIELSDPTDPEEPQRATMFLQPNPGLPEAPLAEVASGGALSRVFLALHGLSAATDQATWIFDEIDAGIGGMTASAVAGRLAALGRGRKAIAITHLAQVAAPRPPVCVEKRRWC